MPVLATGYPEDKANVFAGSPTEEAVCSSEYPEDKANIFCRMSQS